MFLVFIWRMKCFLSILVIEYPISPFLVSWGRFLSTSKSTPTQDYISKKSPPNLSSLLADCRAEVWTNHSHEAKNNYTGYFFDWHWQKTFQSSNSFRIQHQKLANLRIILIQSQNIPQNSCKKQLIVWIILSTTVEPDLCKVDFCCKADPHLSLTIVFVTKDVGTRNRDSHLCPLLWRFTFREGRSCRVVLDALKFPLVFNLLQQQIKCRMTGSFSKKMWHVIQ